MENVPTAFRLVLFFPWVSFFALYLGPSVRRFPSQPRNDISPLGPPISRSGLNAIFPGSSSLYLTVHLFVPVSPSYTPHPSSRVDLLSFAKPPPPPCGLLAVFLCPELAACQTPRSISSHKTPVFATLFFFYADILLSSDFLRRDDFYQPPTSQFRPLPHPPPIFLIAFFFFLLPLYYVSRETRSLFFVCFCVCLFLCSHCPSLSSRFFPR